MTHLNGSALAAKYSAESQPVVYKGVIYITTGNNDVFAVSVASGKILWSYSSGISQKISTICCGWLNRGVAIGDGRVYFGQLDGSVVALDQQTGKQLWKKQLVQWQLGQTITAAPIYIDGKIYIGSVGAEFGVRSFLEALDAATGEQVWRWYTTPAGRPAARPGRRARRSICAARYCSAPPLSLARPTRPARGRPLGGAAAELRADAEPSRGQSRCSDPVIFYLATERLARVVRPRRLWSHCSRMRRECVQSSE